MRTRCLAEIAHITPTYRIHCRSLAHDARTQSSSVVRRPKFSQADHWHARRVNKWTNTLVSAAARKPSQGWKPHRTLRGEEKRLKSSIPTTSSVRASSLEKTTFFAGNSAEEADIDLISPEPVEPGSFVEARRNEEAIHGVVLGQQYVDRQWRTVTLTSKGEVWKHLKGDVVFVLPSLVARDVVVRCGHDEVATQKANIMARVAVLKRIRDIELSLEGAFNVLGRSSQTLYDRVKARDPDEWTKMTLAEAASILCPRTMPSPITILAVHKHLMVQSAYFVADTASYMTSQTFDVRPQSHVDVIDAMNAMRAERRHIVEDFAEKARGIIASNGKMATDSWNEPPSWKRSGQDVWSADDLVIIKFLSQALRPTRSIQVDPYALGVSFVIRKIDPMIPTVDDTVLHKVLVDLGVMPPWQDLVSSDSRLHLEQEADDTSLVMKERNALVEHALSLRSKSKVREVHLGPRDFYPHDAAEHIRYDFGDMPVYVIDDPNAEELDDGISIEHIPSEPGSHWVHAHISDPTSVLPPTHIFAQQARDQLETRYFIHRTWPMLPRSLTQSGASLGSAVANAEKVLTFSGKVDSSGEIVDYRVRAGTIRNIHRLSYDEADLALGQQHSQWRFPFGRDGSSQSSPKVDLDQAHVDSLRAMCAVSDRLVAQRLKLPIFNLAFDQVDIAMSPKIHAQDIIFSAKPMQYGGFPQLTYSVTDISTAMSGFRLTVAEVMKLACRVASQFCTERKIPAVRRASLPYLTPSESTLAKLIAARDPNGFVRYEAAVEHDTIIPPAEYTLEPKGHWPLGIPDGEGYLRVTSPLRRYSDLISHWQIKHALLDKSPRKVPFSANKLEDFIRYLTVKSKVKTRETQNHLAFWALQFIRRWQDDPRRKDGGHDPLQSLVGIPFNVPLVNIRNRSFFCDVRLPTLGMTGVLTGFQPKDVQIGQEVNVKISQITFGTTPRLHLVMK